MSLTSDTLQLHLDTCHKFFERISQSVDSITLRKESVHWEFMAIFKVIICAASCISDTL